MARGRVDLREDNSPQRVDPDRRNSRNRRAQVGLASCPLTSRLALATCFPVSRLALTSCPPVSRVALASCLPVCRVALCKSATRLLKVRVAPRNGASRTLKRCESCQSGRRHRIKAWGLGGRLFKSIQNPTLSFKAAFTHVHASARDVQRAWCPRWGSQLEPVRSQTRFSPCVR